MVHRQPRAERNLGGVGRLLLLRASGAALGGLAVRSWCIGEQGALVLGNPDHHPERSTREPLALRAVTDPDCVRMDLSLEGKAAAVVSPVYRHRVIRCGFQRLATHSIRMP